MSVVAQAKELLNQVLNAYKEEKNIYDFLMSFTIGGITAESFTVNIPPKIIMLQNCLASNAKVNELVLKKTSGNPITHINFSTINIQVKKIILNLDCNSLISFSLSGLRNITDVENVNFPSITDYGALFPNTVINVDFVPDSINPETVSYVIDFSSNKNFSLSTVQSLCNALNPLTDEDISINGGYGMIALTSAVFSLITDEISEAYLAKGWEVIDNG